MSPAEGKARANFNDRLAGYVEVKDRIRMFYDRYPDGRLVTAHVEVTSEPDGKPRVWVKAAAYRTAEDALPAIGYSWMELPGSTTYTRGSEIENTETSAWGRAIGALGIGIDKSIASRQEVQNKDGGEESPNPAVDGLIGTAKASGNDDFNLRLTPDGSTLPFRLSEGRTSYKVRASDVLAELITEHRPAIENQLVTCWGVFEPKSFDKTVEGKKQTITYQVLALTRLKVGDLDLSAPDEPDEDDDAASAAYQDEYPIPVPA